MGTDTVRWRAIVWYRTEGGLVDVEHFLEELEDLHDRVEAGPHFDTIENISIFRINHVDDERLTVEGATQL